MMTEREKMLSGQLYCADEPELNAARHRADLLCRQLNALPMAETALRMEVLRQLLGKVGYNCVILDCAPVTFGDNVFIAPNCGFYTAGHPLDYPTRNALLEFAKPITVGDNVWFGGNVVVLPGVTIGSGSVIGAGSVVSRDIPENVLAVGNPCRPIRSINQEDRSML